MVYFWANWSRSNWVNNIPDFAYLYFTGKVSNSVVRLSLSKECSPSFMLNPCDPYNGVVAIILPDSVILTLYPKLLPDDGSLFHGEAKYDVQLGCTTLWTRQSCRDSRRYQQAWFSEVLYRCCGNLRTILSGEPEDRRSCHKSTAPPRHLTIRTRVYRLHWIPTPFDPSHPRSTHPGCHFARLPWGIFCRSRTSGGST
jgi:hypothetical protein